MDGSVADRLVVVVGGSGFVGRYLVQELAHAGARLRVVVRSPEGAAFLKPLGGLGQIEIVAGDVTRPASIAAAFRHADMGVNLVGILDERAGQKFAATRPPARRRWRRPRRRRTSAPSSRSRRSAPTRTAGPNTPGPRPRASPP